MRFLYGKVKAKKGSIIRVSFSSPTRVLVLTQREFNKYRNNLSYTYYGGFQEESPYEFTAPKQNYWFVVVEKGGTYYEPGDVTASIEMVTPPKVEEKAPSIVEEEPTEQMQEDEESSDDDA